MRGDARSPHLLHVFSTFVPAGPEIRTVRLINALGGAFRHSILAIDGRTEASAQLSNEVEARVLPSLQRAGTPQTVRALRALFRREQPDLVLSYNWGAFDSVLASRSLGRGSRHLHHEDGFNSDEAQSFKARRSWTRRLILPGVSRVIVPSNVLERVARDVWKLRPEQVALIPNGIDLGAFLARDGNPELRAKLGIAREAPVVGFVGHLRPVKNPGRLVRAFAAVKSTPAAQLVILGEGSEREAVESSARQLGIAERVHLVGHRSDTAPWYRVMDVFAISSDSEQMPVALLEAMASSLPVVSTAVGDVAHMLVPGQAPYVVDAARDASDEAFTRALERLIADPAQRKQLGPANRARVEERYSFESMLERYRELYETTLQR